MVPGGGSIVLLEMLDHEVTRITTWCGCGFLHRRWHGCPFAAIDLISRLHRIMLGSVQNVRSPVGVLWTKKMGGYGLNLYIEATRFSAVASGVEWADGVTLSL